MVTLFAAAPVAQAADVGTGEPYFGGGGDAGYLTYYADEGEVNTPTLDPIEGGLRVTDPTAELRSGNGSCAISDDGHTAICLDAEGFDAMDVILGDLDDTAVNNVPDASDDRRFPFGFEFRIMGGLGDDDITGSDAADDSLSGGPGADVMEGRGGDDNVEDSYSYGYPSDSGPGLEANELSGGAGDDYIYGGPGPDDLAGGAGDDILADNHGGAVMTGGDGDDRFNRFAFEGDETPGTAAIDGGAGVDLVSYFLYVNEYPYEDPAPDDPGATVRLDAAGTTTGNGTARQNDSLTGVEDATGTSAADTLIGSSVSNNLVGFQGNDTIDGGGGRDNLEGGTGADTMRAQDGDADRVRCGESSGGETGDSAAVDAGDIVDRCPAEGAGTTVNRPTPPPPDTGNQGQQGPPREVIRVVPGPPPPRDVTRPDISGTKLGRTIRRRSLLRPGYRIQVASKDAEPNQVVATMTGRLKGRARISAIGDLIVAQRTRSFTGRTSFRLRPTGRQRAMIRRGTRLRILVEVRDAAGNVSRRSVRLRVR